MRLIAALITTGGSRQGIQLRSGVELGLRLHERGTVIGHDLVTRIGVAAEEDDGGRDDDHQQQNERESSVEDEEDDTDHTNDQTRSAEHIGEDEHEDGVQEVDDTDGDVERVGALIHPGTQNGGTNQGTRLNKEEADSLGKAAGLPESNKERLDDGIAKHGKDEVVGRGAELDVE